MPRKSKHTKVIKCPHEKIKTFDPWEGSKPFLIDEKYKDVPDGIA